MVDIKFPKNTDLWGKIEEYYSILISFSRVDEYLFSTKWWNFYTFAISHQYFPKVISNSNELLNLIEGINSMILALHAYNELPVTLLIELLVEIKLAKLYRFYKITMNNTFFILESKDRESCQMIALLKVKLVDADVWERANVMFSNR